ncbi:MAG TPA: DUF2786 domain-containing protein [Amycolatopsis sp.]|nr:DUF2786 domain-containing protein [Amycolatopsis sp.]
MTAKVRALLDRAEHPNTPEPEREAAMAKAYELMAKHSIDRAALAAAGQAADEITTLNIRFQAPYAHEKMMLLFHIGDTYGMKAARTGSVTNPAALTIVGWRSDLDQVDTLYTSLLLQSGHGLAAATPPAHLSGAKITVWRRSWLTGFRREVVSRLRATRRRATVQHDREHTGDTSAALVLVDRGEAVSKMFSELFPDTIRPRVSQRRTSASGSEAGRAAGRRADIGGTRVGSAGRRQLGGAR